jgi:magnesium transporter
VSQPHRRERGVKVACLADLEHDKIADYLLKHEFFWLDLENPSEAQIEHLARLFGLHPLTVGDARTFDQRPKLEEYDGYVFLVVYGVDPGTRSGDPLLREFHLIISGDYVVTIHRSHFAALDDVRTRYGGSRVRSEQFLVYTILDAIISTFTPVLTRIDEDIDEIEQDVVEQPTQEILQRIFALKRDLVAMRRVVTPQRDLFARNAERIAEIRGLQSDDRLYFRDLYDSLVRVSELVDSYRDLLSGATDLYLSTVANRQGEINKQLTMIATIFLPLTFLTGFFGQNFSYMINHWINSERAFFIWGVGLLVVSVAGFLIYFRRKKWL